MGHENRRQRQTQGNGYPGRRGIDDSSKHPSTFMCLRDSLTCRDDISLSFANCPVSEVSVCLNRNQAPCLFLLFSIVGPRELSPTKKPLFQITGYTDVVS